MYMSVSCVCAIVQHWLDGRSVGLSSGRRGGALVVVLVFVFVVVVNPNYVDTLV